MPGRVALVVLLLVASTGSSSAALRALFASGDVGADGIGVATMTNVRARGANDLAFTGRSDAVVVGRGGTLTVLAASGAVLPPPLAGTFNEVGAPTFTASGTVLFSASVNSPAAHSAVFAAGPDGITPLLFRDEAVAALSANASGDVVIRDSGITLWQHDTRTAVFIASRRDPLFPEDQRPLVRFFGRPVIGSTRAVAFAAEGRFRKGGVFLWRPSGGVTALVREFGHPALRGSRFRRLWRAPVSINTAERVAFVGDFCVDEDCGTGVFRIDSKMGSIDLLARTNQQAGAELIADISDRFVGIDDAGDVAFIARLQHGQFLLRAGPTGLVIVAPMGGTRGITPGLEDWRRVAWLDDGAILALYGVVRTLVPSEVPVPAPGFRPRGVDANSAGDVAFVTSRSVLYRLRGRTAEPVLVERSMLQDVGTVTDPADGDSRFVGKELLVLARLASGRWVLGRNTPQGFVPLVMSETTTPLGGTFGLDGETLRASDTVADTLLFVAGLGFREGVGLFRLRPTGEVVGLLDSDALGASGARDLSLVPGGGDEPIVAASFAESESALIAIDPLGPRTIVASGDALPGGRTLRRVQAAVVDSRRVVFAGFVQDAPEAVALFVRGRKPHAAVRPLLRADGSIPGGGKVIDLLPSIPVSGPAIAVRTKNGHAVLELRGRGLAPILRSDGSVCGREGEASELLSVSVAERRAVALGYLALAKATAETSFVRGLLEGATRGVCPLAVDGQRTPLGGTLAPFADEAAFVPTHDGVIFAADVAGGRARRAIWAAKRQRRADSTRSAAIASTIPAIATGQFPSSP